ncbi:hypothetical protein LSTR_LSTR011636 [Laodelphax striatellus]|uniref:RING-type domain-containing protein n=1 Tax=Laodelphax striatellus TaxID=195883 RepID=A0A482X8R2_LAOST|nr:hypothetical protein LSTR_LSTR011636 [Laodelphax striatellus]
MGGGRLRSIEDRAFGDVQRTDTNDLLRIRRRNTPFNNTATIRSALRRLVHQERWSDIVPITFLILAFILLHPDIDWMLPVGAEVVVAARLPAARRRRPAQQRPIRNQEQQPLVAAQQQPRVNTCVICLLRESTHIALPCGHICMCDECADENWLLMIGPRCVTREVPSIHGHGSSGNNFNKLKFKALTLQLAGVFAVTGKPNLACKQRFF